MTDIKEIKLVDVKNNSNIINKLNSIYKLWGYEEVSPSFINTLETIKGRGVIDENQVVGIVSNNSLCLRPEMTTSIVKLSSTRLINKKRPIRLFTNGMVFDKKQNNKNSFKLQEKLQSGIELIGYDTKYPEIEVINILFDSIDNINLKYGCNLFLLVSTTKIMDLILDKYKDNNYSEFCYLTHKTRGVRRGGAAAVDLAFVAAGKVDGYWERGLEVWDLAAGAIIVKEAGGIISDYPSGEFNLSSGRILACSPSLENELKNELDKVSPFKKNLYT